MGVDSIGRICFRINNICYYSQQVASPGLPPVPLLIDNRCHHIAVKRVGTEISFYIDGTFISSVMVPGLGNLNTIVFNRIGLENISLKTSALKGSLDYLRIWNYAIKDNDIYSNQFSYIGSSDTTLLAGWYFAQNPDTIVYDHSSNLHHGFILKSYSNPINIGPSWITVTCGSEEGNFYYPEPASNLACINNPDPIYCNAFNFICNGDFEQENASPGSSPMAAFGGCTASGSSNEVINWCSTSGMPSYFGRNTLNFNYRLPFNLYSNSDNCIGGIDTWSGPGTGNDHYALLNYIGANVYGIQVMDGIQTKLISALLPGSTYILNFRALYAYDWSTSMPIGTPSIKFTLENTTTAATFAIGVVQIPLVCNWNQYQLTFNTPAFPAGFDRLKVELSGTNNPNSFYFYYVDDFEIYQQQSTYPVWLSGIGSQRPQEITSDVVGNTYIAGTANQEITYPNAVIQGIPDEGTGFIASFDACGNQRWAHNTNLASTAYFAVHYSNTQQLVYGLLYDASGLSICSVDPASGSILSTLPLPATSSSTNVINTKYYAPTDEWYILTKDGFTGLYLMYFYNFTGSVLLFSPSPVFLPDDLVDFSISTPTTLCLIFNQNANNAYLQYPAARATLAGGVPYPVVNNGATGTVYLRTIDQNSSGITCIGGEYQDGSILVGGTTIAQYTTPSTLGNYTNAFTFLFNLGSQSVVPNSGRFFGNDGLSKVLEIVSNNQSDFIASGIISGSGFNPPSHSNLANSLLSNPVARGFFVSKLDGTTGNDIWIQQGTTTGIGQWTQHISVGNNSEIFLTGYLNGTIDFLQGDTWSSVLECDNTYLLKVFDGQNQGIIERPARQDISANNTSAGNSKGRVILVNRLSDLFERSPSLLQEPLSMYDYLGREIFSRSGHDQSGDLSEINLGSGMYFLRLLRSNESIQILLSK